MDRKAAHGGQGRVRGHEQGDTRPGKHMEPDTPQREGRSGPGLEGAGSGAGGSIVSARPGYTVLITVPGI